MKNNNIIQNGDAMSGNEPTGARRRHKTKVAVWLGVAGMCATGASLIPVGGHTQAAFVGESEGMLCTDGTAGAGTRTFDLVAADGYISTPTATPSTTGASARPVAASSCPGRCCASIRVRPSRSTWPTNCRSPRRSSSPAKKA